MMDKKTTDARKPGAGEHRAPVARSHVASEVTSLTTAASNALAAHLSRNHVISLATPIPTLNVYRLLRTQVMTAMQENGWMTLGVTSCREGEGKTTAALNLAVAIAMNPGASALVVDCKLNGGRVHEILGLHLVPGLADYLVNDVRPESLVSRTPINRLALIPAGAPLVNSAEMLSSDRMRQFIEWVKRERSYSAVIFDMPSVLDSVDALSLTPMLDAVLLVAEERRTRREDLVQTAQLLAESNLIGTVLNRASI